MDIKYWKDPDGIWWREIVSADFWNLKDLENDYRKKGHKTQFNVFNSCEDLFSLTVMERAA